MIFFFGTRATSVLTELVPNLSCQYCGEQRMYLVISSRYFHFFWIPMFPIGKSTYTVCNHCKQTLSINQMPQEYRIAIADQAAEAKTPVWQFAGLMIIGVCIAVPILIGIIAKITH